MRWSSTAMLAGDWLLLFMGAVVFGVLTVLAVRERRSGTIGVKLRTPRSLAIAGTVFSAVALGVLGLGIGALGSDETFVVKSGRLTGIAVHEWATGVLTVGLGMALLFVASRFFAQLRAQTDEPRELVAPTAAAPEAVDGDSLDDAIELWRASTQQSPPDWNGATRALRQVICDGWAVDGHGLTTAELLERLTARASQSVVDAAEHLMARLDVARFAKDALKLEEATSRFEEVVALARSARIGG